MKYTIKEIADLCQVGKSTVSRVLNNDPKVRAETREKVQAVIDSLGFQPNRSARAMRGVSEPVVGIIVSRLNSGSEAQTLSAILNYLYQHHITPMVVESQFQAEQVARHFALFQQRNVSGVIVFGFSPLPERVLKQWRGSLVVVARHFPHFSSIYYDDENAVYALMNRLYQQGHRQIGYIGVDEHDETTGKLRTDSYLHFCQTHHLQPYLALTSLGVEQGYAQCEQLLQTPISSLVCATTSLALGAFQCLQKHQQNRPLAYIGQDRLLQHFAPELISLDFGYEQAGKWAAEALLAQLNGDNALIQRKVPFHLR